MCVQYTYVHICVYFFFFQSRRDDFFLLQMISFYISKRKLLKCLPGKIDFPITVCFKYLPHLVLSFNIITYTHSLTTQQKGFNSRTVRGQPTKIKDKRLIKLKETKTKQKKRKLWVLEFLLKRDGGWKGEVYASNNNNKKAT